MSDHIRLALMGLAIIAAGVVLVALFGAPKAPDPYEGFLGNSATYRQIDAQTDCATLLAQYDAFVARRDQRPVDDPEREVDLAYAAYIQERYDGIGCRTIIEPPWASAFRPWVVRSPAG